MENTHPLYKKILDQLIDRDRRGFLPPAEERLGPWLRYLTEDEERTSIINLKEKGLDKLSIDSQEG